MRPGRGGDLGERGPKLTIYGMTDLLQGCPAPELESTEKQSAEYVCTPTHHDVTLKTISYSILYKRIQQHEYQMHEVCISFT